MFRRDRADATGAGTVGTGMTTTAQVLAEFEALGLAGEELAEYELVALDVPDTIGEGGARAVKDLLVAGQELERWW